MPPATPITIDSPITWLITRRLRQPSALSVPNSRTRRATADIVSKLASRSPELSSAAVRRSLTVSKAQTRETGLVEA